MEFITLFAGSILVVWVFFAFNDLAVLSRRLRRAFAEADVLDKERLSIVDRLVDVASTAGCNVAALKEAVSKLRSADAVARPHAERTLTEAISKIVAERAGFPDVCAQVIGEVDQVERKRSALTYKIAGMKEHYQRARASIPACWIADRFGFPLDPSMLAEGSGANVSPLLAAKRPSTAAASGG